MQAMSGKAPSTGVAGEEMIAPPVCSIFRRFLKRQGLKFTTERAEILNAVLEKDGVFEADQLMMEMRDAGYRVSKATIYRTLKHLLDAQIICEVLIDSRQAHYELSIGKRRQGHLVCIETGRIVEIPSPWLEPVQARICREHGFEPVSYRFVIYGISPEAQKGEQAEAGDD
jgi:Fur family ferric uptake transcriptional regulator